MAMMFTVNFLHSPFLPLVFLSPKSNLCLLKSIGFSRRWHTVNIAHHPQEPGLVCMLEAEEQIQMDIKKKCLMQQVSQSLLDLSKMFVKRWGERFTKAPRPEPREVFYFLGISRTSLTRQRFFKYSLFDPCVCFFKVKTLLNLLCKML